MKKNNIFLCMIMMLTSFIVEARSSKHSNVYADAVLLYKRGAYVQSISKLNIIQKDRKGISFARYWKGMCYSKIQEYDKAIINFKEAIKHNTEQKNVYYLLGQGYYASNELENAKKAFKESIDNGFKQNESLYYIGFVNQTLERYTQAIINYKILLDKKGVEEGLKQSTSYQYAEVILAKLEKESKGRGLHRQSRERVKRYIIPKYIAAYDINRDTPLANDIDERLYKIREKYGVSQKTFVNGKKYPKKYYKFYIKERVAFDSNVILESSDATSTALYKNSGIITSTFHGSGTAIHKRRFVFSPEITIKNVFHTRQNASDIHQNDAITIEPALKMRLEHKRFGKPAAMSFNIDYNYTKRDLKKNHSFNTYGKTLAVSIGDRFKYFSFGLTGVKFKHKAFASYSPALDSKSNIFSLTQSISMSRGDSLSLFVQADLLSAEQSTDSTNALLVSCDWTRPSYYKGFDLGIGFSVTATDTKKQKATRGTEMIYNPSISASRGFSKSFDFEVVYSYSRKTSKEETTYAYSQHVIATEFKYSF